MPKTKPTTPEPTDASVRRGRRHLLLIALLFLIPVVLATSLYFGGWRPQGRALHHGELVQPVYPVSDIALRKADGASYRFHALRGSWTFVTFSHLPCEQVCRNNLYKMQQVRLTQGKDAGRVQRAVIAIGSDSELSTLQTEYPGLMAFTGAPPEIQKMINEFAGPSGAGQDRVYLMDPLGNVVLRYVPDADPSGMRKDLARLLRLSQIG